MTNTLTISRETLAKCLRDALTIRFEQDSHVEELRALLAKSELADHCKQCAEVVKTWPESKRDCLGKIAAPVVERQDSAPSVELDLVYNKMTEGLHIRRWENFGGLREGVHRLYTSAPAPVAVVLPRYTCIGKGGEYELLGSAIGAGTLKDMSAIPVYRDTTTGQLFVRTPLDFATRMDCLDKVKEMNP